MTHRINRRTFVVNAAGAGACALMPGLGLSSGTPAYSGDWKEAERIRKSITLPQIPQRDFNIREFGAVGDGLADCSEAFAAAISACKQAGGGRIVVHGGVYRTGPIHLGSNMDLHVAEGATILFIPEPER